MNALVSLAARNLTRNRRRSAISLSALALGVVIVVALKGLSDGFIALVVSSVVDGRTGALQVHKTGWFKDREALPLELSLPRSAELEARMLAVPGVKGVAPRIQFTGLVSDGSSQSTFLGTAIEPGTEKRACPNWGNDLLPGSRDLEPKDYAQALVGVGLAKSLGLGRGTPASTVRLSLSASSPTGRLNAMEVGVNGVTETAIRFENKRVVTVPLAFAQDLLGLEGRVTEYAVAVARLEALDEVAVELQAALGPDFEVQTWREVQPYLFGVVRRQETVVMIAAFIFFLAIVTVIANALSTSVLERVAEIGTMLSFGMRRRQILALFVLEALMLGAVGGLFGAVFGALVVRGLHQVGLPLKAIVTPGVALIRPVVSWDFTLWAVLGAAAIGVVASALPALKASRLSPADALRSN